MDAERKRMESQGEIDLSVYIQPLMEYKWRIIAAALIATGIAAALLTKVIPEFKAEATLLIETEENKAVSIGDFYAVDSSRQEYLLTQFEILKSEQLAEQVMDEFNLQTKPEFNPALIAEKSFLEKLFIDLFGKEKVSNQPSQEKLDYEARQITLDNFRSKIKVSPLTGTQLVTISVESQDPELAAQLANALGDAYIESHLEARIGMTNKALDWLKERSERVASELQQAELALQKFKNDEQIVDMEDGFQTMNSSTIQNLNRSLLEVRNTRIELEALISQLDSALTSDFDLRTINKLNESIAVQDLIKAERVAESRLIELDQRYGPKHPKMIAAEADLKQTRAKLESQLSKEVNELNNQLKALKTRESQLERDLGEAEGQYLLTGQKEGEYRRLQANVERISELNNLMATRFKEMDITRDFNAANARFTDPAKVPIKPVKPNKKLILGLTFFLTTLIGCIFTLTLRFMNNTVRTATDVEDELSQRLLGVIPGLKSEKNKPIPLYTYFDQTKHSFSEAVKSLRTSYLLTYLNQPNTSTLITSAAPGEGKSTVALNFAFSLSQMGKVLLIDADMRRPSIAKRMSLPGYQPGLSNVLSGSHTLSQCIITDAKSGVDLLPAGQVSPDALELISSSSFAELLEKLKGQYSRIIIDSPPCQAVSDALVLAKYADSTLFVVKSAATGKEAVKSALGKLAFVGAKIDGVVMNSVDMTAFSGQYSEFYGYLDYASEKEAKAS
ncbi:chain-length determining protein [Alteromonas aestuariivivens]|uniref:non-specific protein-tyrosine kinase n=1 Tax=Alteromonas aestuariivivens TaxID=1938339 RepID=A0A3D8MC87_9ALTE|nr:polysaccharide biosynthesis tyrosine autokinase [Alteromonas aestuariivivens]RDV28128.1 chain-length determining protein [Alteromonas aestuariivivens]